VIPVARRERVGSVSVNVFNFSVTSVNDEASSFPLSHRLSELYGVFLACEPLSGLTRCDCGYQPTARFGYDVQRSDDVANPCQVYFTGSGCRLYFSFLRLHKSQTTTFRRLRKLGHRYGERAGLYLCLHASARILKHPHAAGCRLVTDLFFQPVQDRRIVEIFWRSFGRLGADGR
jgi:hypothetical protein